MGMIIEDRSLRNRRFVFRDRADAGRRLAEHLRPYADKSAIVLAIPSGGLPVAAEVARKLATPLGVVIVRKLQIPTNPEAGFGAISMSGEAIINEELMPGLDLSEWQIEEAKGSAMGEGRARHRALVGDSPDPELEGRTVIIVDDGLATGYTMLAAVKEVRRKMPERIIVAVPTGSDRSVEKVAKVAEEVVCLNIRGMPFAVADAYTNWYDLTEQQAVDVLRRFG